MPLWLVFASVRQSESALLSMGALFITLIVFLAGAPLILRMLGTDRDEDADRDEDKSQ